MAGASTAKTSLIIDTNSAPLTAGLSEASNQISSWISSVGMSLGGKLGGALGGVTSAFSSMTQGVIGIFRGAFAGAGESLIGRYKALSDQISECTKDARRLGTTSSDMMALAYVGQKAGLSYEELTKSLGKMRQNVGGDMITNFKNLSDQVKGLEDPTLRAQIAVENFGKGGVRMLTMLDQGGDSFLAKLQQAKDLGLALSDDEIGKMSEAKKGISEIKDTFQGLLNKIVVSFAPLLTTLSDMFKAISPYIQYIGKLVGEIVDTYFKVFVEIIKEVWNQCSILWNSFVEGAGILGDTFGQWFSWTTIIRGALYILAVALSYVWDILKAGAGIVVMVCGQIARVIGNTAAFFGSKWGEALAKMGQAAVKTGWQMTTSFGQTHAAIDRIFANLDKKQEVAKKKQEEIKTAFEYHGATAMMQGSKEALTIEAKWKTAFMAEADPLLAFQKEHLNESKGQTTILNKIEQNTKPTHYKDTGRKIEVI